uniref:muscular LMNA-interacting protein isoform X3 n=1 Tax=Jaculus jaculus TaxID=51337 RepID=UPI001E1B10A2|nr:muscular LMNA-interacting protein isoform X3 [Jaculus jaculus]
MLPEQGLLSDCGDNYFQMNSCILAGTFQTTPKVSSGDYEAKPLTFTFVPAVRRLPTHIQWADTCKFLVNIPEEPSDKSPETVNRSNSRGYMTFSRGSHLEKDHGTLTYSSGIIGRSSQAEEFEPSKPPGMQQSDLFKAEYVFIVDSEGEDEVTSNKGEQGHPEDTGRKAVPPKSLDVSSVGSDVVRPKIWGPDLKASSHPQIPQGMATQPKEGQLTSPTTSEQLACKPPTFSFVSSTNQKMPPVPANLKGASVLEQSHSRRLDVSGALLEETAVCFQSTTHLPLFSELTGSSVLSLSSSTQPPGSNLSGSKIAAQTPGQTPEALKMTAPPSHVLDPGEKLRSSSLSSSDTSLKSNPASYIPVRIVMHSLSPSPKPFTTSFHGSLPTVCSQTSSSGNLSKSGAKSPVPSRLSLLTAMLKSNPSHQRPLSPASCPTFSLNSLASSTLTLDQKVQPTSPTPKKSLSSSSLGVQSPEKGEHWADSAMTQQSCHLPFFTKPTPLSQGSLLSAPAPGNSSLASLNVEKMPSPASKSNVRLFPLQTNTIPPVVSSSSLSSSKARQDGDFRGPEKPRDVYTCPSTLPSCAISSTSPINESTALSSPEKHFHPSPGLSDLIDRSKRVSCPQRSSPELNPSVLPSPVSSAGSASLPNFQSSTLPPTNLTTQACQHNLSALYPDHGNVTLSSRTGRSENTLSSHQSPASAPSLPISLARTKELLSPCALSMTTGLENKKPKQYKTMPSYKAFAAIPTNTLLLEQKALDEPASSDSVSKASTLDLPVEAPTTLPRAPGRETKYANLSSPSTLSENQLTKPGVIRPVPIKSKPSLKKEEEVYEPNPFSKYLEENSDLFSEQDVTVPHKPVSLHPLYQTKLYPPAKSLLHPQTLSHADCLTPGPFSHLSSFSLRDEQENSPTLLSQNAYNKLGHPMVAIPEHESLDSKE